MDLGLYLGFPLTDKRPSKDHLGHILKKIQTKLASWKTKYLSKAGKASLITATLTSIPAYTMNYISLLVSISKAIDSTCRKLFWGVKESETKVATISWDKISGLES